MVQTLQHYYRYSFLGSFWQRGAFMIHDNFRLSGTLLGYVMAAAFSLVALFFAVVPILKKQVNNRATPSVGFFCICIFLTCSSACMLFMPVSLPGYSFLYQRFSVLVFLGVILVGSIVAPKALSAFLKTGLCAIVLLHALVWFQCFRAFDAENAGFDKAFFSVCASGDVVGGLIYDYRFRNVSMYDNCPDYYTAWTSGVSTTRLADDRSFVIRRRVGTDVLPQYIGWVGKGGRGYDGRYANLDYLLVRGEVPVKAQGMLENFTVVNQKGAWLLYANRERVPGVHIHRQ